MMFRYYLLLFATAWLQWTSAKNKEQDQAYGFIPSNSFPSCPAQVSLNATANPWTSYTLHPHRTYANKVRNAVEGMVDSSLKNAALKVADTGTFLWINSLEDAKEIEQAVVDMPCNHILGLVLASLPNKPWHDCVPAEQRNFASNTMFQEYREGYVDSISKIIQKHPDRAFALIVAPGAFPDYFVHPEITTCSQLANSYRENTPYLLKTLNLPNVIMYLDVGNGGSMNWNRDRNTSAKEIIGIYQSAGRPTQFRGFATNVASWNSWDLQPGEFASTIDVAPSKAENEKILVHWLSRALRNNGMPVDATHAITDTSRAGVFGLRGNWEDWCNINGAGLGRRPSSDTKDEILDAFVWVKPPGESDGSSDPSSATYSPFCSRQDAFQPSPGYGEWSQAYFEMLVRNAKPSLMDVL